jgi:hypothetical protein
MRSSFTLQLSAEKPDNFMEDKPFIFIPLPLGEGGAKRRVRV